MKIDHTSLGPEPETKLIIVISTIVLVASLGLLAWENWKVLLAMLGILFHIIVYVQKELEGVIKYCSGLSQHQPRSTDHISNSID